MTERSLREQMILDEIAGKNAAIHAYDRIIWIVRTGYLTLFFAGWGLVIRAVLENNPPQDILDRYMPLMLVLSCGLTIGGLLVDVNYVLRKFRVIASLNKLMKMAFCHGVEIDELKDDEALLLTLFVLLATLGNPHLGSQKVSSQRL